MEFKACYLSEIDVNGTIIRRPIPIVTVLADSLEEAVTKLEEALTSNPSRKPYHAKWVADGRITTIVIV